MKKLLLVLAFPLLLVSCGKANAGKEVSFAGMAEKMEAPQALPKALRSVGKFSGSIKTVNGSLIGMTADINKSVSGNVTYGFDNAGVAQIEGTATQPDQTFKPHQLNYGRLAASTIEEVEQTFPANGYSVTWHTSAKYYVAPFRIVWELAAYDSNEAGAQAVYYQCYDMTYNDQQWLTKLHYIGKINYFHNGQAAYYTADTTGTYSYTYY